MSTISLQTALLSNNLDVFEATQRNEFIMQYPYCSVAQVLHASMVNTTEQIQKASLYKGNPVKFVALLKQASVSRAASLQNNVSVSNNIDANSIDSTLKENTVTTIDNITEKIVVNEVPKIAALENETVDDADLLDKQAQISIANNSYLDSKNVPLEDVSVQEFVAVAKEKKDVSITPADEQQLIVTRSFNEWLLFFKQKKDKEIEETKSKDALTAMWQHQKLSAAAGEENEVVPEAVFNQAINSISPQENLISESLASILVQQGKLDKAKEMYKKLSLKNPEKSAYFASLIKNL